MTSHRNQYLHSVANTEQDNEFLNLQLESYPPEFFLQQDGPGGHIELEKSTKNLERENQAAPNVANPTAYSNASLQSQNIRTTGSDTTDYHLHVSLRGAASGAFAQEGMATPPDQFDNYFKSGTGCQWEGSFNFGESPFSARLPAPRADAWTTAQEDYLMSLKRHGKTFPQIRLDMWTTFGVDKNPNVLSKKYRAILERNAKENVIAQSLNGALPNILQCFEDELGKLNLEPAEKELVREELQRKLPKFVRSLDLERKGVESTFEGNQISSGHADDAMVYVGSQSAA